MVIIFILFMLCCGYYTFTYGISLWKDDKNKQGSIAAAAFAVIGTVIPGIVLFIKNI